MHKFHKKSCLVNKNFAFFLYPNLYCSSLHIFYIIFTSFSTKTLAGGGGTYLSSRKNLWGAVGRNLRQLQMKKKFKLYPLLFLPLFHFFSSLSMFPLGSFPNVAIHFPTSIYISIQFTVSTSFVPPFIGSIFFISTYIFFLLLL